MRERSWDLGVLVFFMLGSAGSLALPTYRTRSYDEQDSLNEMRVCGQEAIQRINRMHMICQMKARSPALIRLPCEVANKVRVGPVTVVHLTH